MRTCRHAAMAVPRRSRFRSRPRTHRAAPRGLPRLPFALRLRERLLRRRRRFAAAHEGRRPSSVARFGSAYGGGIPGGGELIDGETARATAVVGTGLSVLGCA